MLAYWLFFLFFVAGALFSLRGNGPLAATPADLGGQQAPAHRVPPQPTGMIFGFGLVVVFVMVGLRFQVGGDWINYANIFERTRFFSLGQQFAAGDPAYQFLNWLVARLGVGVWLVNAICAIPFVWGLRRLTQLQPEPWLLMVVAIPYLIIVVAMGYTRQASALGILMMGIAAVIRRDAGVFRFALYVLAAALFHRTAIVFLPLMAFVFPTSRATNAITTAAVTVSLYVFFLQDNIELLNRNYIEAEYNSQGAAVRIAQLALAASIFFVAGKALHFEEIERKVWRNLSAASLLMVPVLLLSPSSTVVDRISLYLLPLQLAVLGRLPLWIRPPLLARLMVVLYSTTVLYVWLNYAFNVRGWLPYDNVLFGTDPR